MAIPSIFAMTGGEIFRCPSLPAKIAWMGCHFSTDDTGLSGLPTDLPPGSLLVIDDATPIAEHDPKRIIDQLLPVISGNRIDGILMDLQRPATQQAKKMAAALVQAMSCPVALPPVYAQGLDCPVFVPPIPPYIPASEYLKPWQHRRVWLELALDASVITLTDVGCSIKYVPVASPATSPQHDTELHCHYSTAVQDDAIRFYLYRTAEDVAALLDAIPDTCVSCAIGLFQELG